MPVIAVNGTSLNYVLDGKAGAPLVVLSNSLSTDLRMWQPQAALLAGQYQVLRYDTRGHGASPATPAPYSVAMLADDLAGLLDGLGFASAHIVGLSLGGMTAQMRSGGERGAGRHHLRAAIRNRCRLGQTRRRSAGRR